MRKTHPLLFLLSDALRERLQDDSFEPSVSVLYSEISDLSGMLASTEGNLNPGEAFFLFAVISADDASVPARLQSIRNLPARHAWFHRFILISDSPLNSDLTDFFELGMMAYWPLSNGVAGFTSLVEAHIRQAQEHLVTEAQLKEASDLAVVAMAASSQLGEVIRFIELANQCATSQELGNHLMVTLEKMGLTGSLLLDMEEDSLFLGSPEKEPDVRAFLRQHEGVDRFMDDDHCTAVYFEGVSGFIENMPGPHSEEQGRTKDTLFRLFEGTEARLKQIQTEQQIHQAEEMRHQFLAVLAHELRTPMNASLGLLRRLNKLQVGETLSERHISALHTADEANERLAGVIEDIVDLASVSVAKKIPKTRALLNEICSSPLLEAKKEAENKGLAFIEEIPLNFDIDTEPSRLRRVLRALLSNAVKYSQSGEIHIRLEPATDTECFLLSIEDTGCGIDPCRVKSILQPFTIGENYLTRTQEGAGLGLAIAAEFTRELGGTLNIHSEAGAGTRVNLILPRYTAIEPESHAESNDVELF